MDEHGPVSTRRDDAELDALLRQAATAGIADIADGGFAERVMLRLPPHADEARRETILLLSYLAGVSLASAASLLGLADFVASVAASTWWHLPEAWLAMATPLALLSWFSIRFSNELVDA